MVVDTSVILAVLFREPAGEWAVQQLNEHSSELRMSTVNLAEALIRAHDRQPQLKEELENLLFESAIRFVSPDVEQARLAAGARMRFPLNLGDCFAYALAVVENCPILAIDKDFRRTDRPVVMP
ncbi:MAG TPA: type II toxin-antitoxin system VapC family toxin [Bdellovibrionota bacterium]|nr:type II toxin-antitoxin system VapC family toxin [Bdellovibrionota bacterium]